MRREDVTIGMKVVPHSKTGRMAMNFKNYLIREYSDSSKFFLKNGFLFVTVDEKDGNFLLNNTLFESGDFFLAEDFEPFVEPEAEVVEEIDENDESDGLIIPKLVPIKVMSCISKEELTRLQDIEKKYNELTALLFKNALDSLALYEQLKI